MVVIADTSPLNYLVLVDAVDVLQKLYHRVLIPDAVWKELRHPDAPKAVANWVASLPSWIELAPSTHVVMDPDLSELDAGESAAIALALTDHANSLLLMDDFKAREVAARHGISTIGTLGILRDAAAIQLIDLPTVLGRLRQTTFRAPRELLSDLLRQDATRRTDKK